jgi:hypothetical protein
MLRAEKTGGTLACKTGLPACRVVFSIAFSNSGSSAFCWWRWLFARSFPRASCPLPIGRSRCRSVQMDSRHSSSTRATTRTRALMQAVAASTPTTQTSTPFKLTRLLSTAHTSVALRAPSIACSPQPRVSDRPRSYRCSLRRSPLRPHHRPTSSIQSSS